MQIDSLLFAYRNRLPEDVADERYSELIRSYLFKKGIRSRINKKPYPENATVVYPKYKVAVYVSDWLESGKSDSGDIQISIDQYFENVIEDSSAKYSEAIELGWDAIVISPERLQEVNYRATLDWVEKYLKKERNDNEKGMILYHG